jgi:hypothetical protein
MLSNRAFMRASSAPIGSTRRITLGLSVAKMQSIKILGAAGTVDLQGHAMPEEVSPFATPVQAGASNEVPLCLRGLDRRSDLVQRSCGNQRFDDLNELQA